MNELVYKYINTRAKKDNLIEKGVKSRYLGWGMEGGDWFCPQAPVLSYAWSIKMLTNDIIRMLKKLKWVHFVLTLRGLFLG